MERREFEERTQLERYNAFHDGLRMLEESLRSTCQGIRRFAEYDPCL